MAYEERIKIFRSQTRELYTESKQVTYLLEASFKRTSSNLLNIESLNYWPQLSLSVIQVLKHGQAFRESTVAKLTDIQVQKLFLVCI